MTDALLTLSASKLKTFSSCERKFYYEYVDKRETKRHPAAALGTAVHKTIEKVYLEQVDPITTFLDVFGNELISCEIEPNEVKPELTRDGLKMVTLYKYEKRQPVEMEVEFYYPF